MKGACLRLQGMLVQSEEVSAHRRAEQPRQQTIQHRTHDRHTFGKLQRSRPACAPARTKHTHTHVRIICCETNQVQKADGQERRTKDEWLHQQKKKQNLFATQQVYDFEPSSMRSHPVCTRQNDPKESSPKYSKHRFIRISIRCSTRHLLWSALNNMETNTP